MGRSSLAALWLVVAAVSSLSSSSLASVVYAGQTSPSLGGGAALSRWDGSSWSTVAEVSDGGVNAVAMYGLVLFVGGSYRVNAGQGVNVIALAIWTGSAWYTPFNSYAIAFQTNSVVYALEINNNNLYIGGAFTLASTGVIAANLAVWNGYSVTAVGATVNGAIFAITSYGNTLYVGGGFTAAGGLPTHGVAQWSGGEWSALGTGMNGPVATLTMYNAVLFAGGAFTTASGQSANGIARWNGATWTALGNGLNGDVQILFEFNNQLYVGGTFSTADTISANNIAYWNGNNWEQVGSGVNDTVSALADYNNDLFVGGDFGSASGSAAQYAAYVNTGNTWYTNNGAGLVFPVSAYYAGCDVNQVYPSCLTPGAIAGIVIGVIFGSAILMVIIVALVHRHQRRHGRRGKQADEIVMVPVNQDVVVTTVAYPVAVPATVVYQSPAAPVATGAGTDTLVLQTTS